MGGQTGTGRNQGLEKPLKKKEGLGQDDQEGWSSVREKEQVSFVFWITA